MLKLSDFVAISTAFIELETTIEGNYRIGLVTALVDQQDSFYYYIETKETKKPDLVS